MITSGAFLDEDPTHSIHESYAPSLSFPHLSGKKNHLLVTIRSLVFRFKSESGNRAACFVDAVLLPSTPETRAFPPVLQVEEE